MHTPPHFIRGARVCQGYKHVMVLPEYVSYRLVRMRHEGSSTPQKPWWFDTFFQHVHPKQRKGQRRRQSSVCSLFQNAGLQMVVCERGVWVCLPRKHVLQKGFKSKIKHQTEVWHALSVGSVRRAKDYVTSTSQSFMAKIAAFSWTMNYEPLPSHELWTPPKILIDSHIARLRGATK